MLYCNTEHCVEPAKRILFYEIVLPYNGFGLMIAEIRNKVDSGVIANDRIVYANPNWAIFTPISGTFES